MGNYKTQGIVLKSFNLGEADKVFEILTLERGKISALAKAVRKPLAKLSGHLDLLYHVDLVLAEGRNFDLITSSIVLNSFSSIRKDLKKLAFAFYLLRLVDKFAAREEANSSLFQLTLLALQKLGFTSNELILRYFEARLLSISGYRPELYHCLTGKERLTEKDQIFISSQWGGLVCQIHKNLATGKTGDFIDPQTIKFLRALFNYPLNRLETIVVSDLIMDRSKKVLRSLLEFQTAQKITDNWSN